MIKEMAYIYTGNTTINSSDIGSYTIDGLYSFYNYLEGIIATKLGVDEKAVELCKFSCDPEKDFIKVNYKLHYNVDINKVRNAVFTALDQMKSVNATEVNFRAIGDRNFVIDIDVVAKSSDPSSWKCELIPSIIEIEACKTLPKDLIPAVKFNVSYPVTTMASCTIE